MESITESEGSNPNQVVIPNLVFTRRDIESMAEAHDVPIDTAIERVAEWSQAISETAIGLVNEQLESVIRTGQP